MGNGSSKSRSRCTRGQSGDFSADYVQNSKSSLAGHTGDSYQSAPPPYTTSATSAMPWSSENDARGIWLPKCLVTLILICNLMTSFSSSVSPPTYACGIIRRCARDATPIWYNYYHGWFFVDGWFIMEGGMTLVTYITCRWHWYRHVQAKQALATLADVASQYDANGVDIHFLNHYGSITGVTVSSLFVQHKLALISLCRSQKLFIKNSATSNLAALPLLDIAST